MSKEEPNSAIPPGAGGEVRLLLADFPDLDALIRFCWETIKRPVAQHGLGQKEGAIQLALREALCNAHCHGNHGDKQLPIFFSWRCNGPELSCSVRDSGRGFDHQQLPDPTCPANCAKEQGRGLFIIRFLAQHLTWQEGGRQLTMVFGNKPRRPPRSGSGKGQKATAPKQR